MTEIYENVRLDTCPKCKSDGLRAEGMIDLVIYSTDQKGYYTFEEDGNEPTVTGFYCIECGAEFTREELDAFYK